ncbi:MAG: DUF4251 domain-containing protein [Ginsengibacter sp.]
METKRNFSLIKFSILGLLVSLFLVQCTASKKIEKLTSGDIKSMIDSSRFVFNAERVNPLRGRTRYLTSSYDVTVKKDSVESFLPYFGRAYQAPMDPSKGGIQFTSTDFSYMVNSGRQDDQWDVVIKPKDNNDVQEMRFNIFGNGTASLNVISTHKDAISFTGHIESIKK